MKERPKVWIVESMCYHGPNVVSWKIVFGAQWTPLIREYLPTFNLDHVLDIEEILNCFLWRNHIVMGYLNADIGRLQNPQNQQVADFLASFRLVDFLSYF